VEALLLPAAHWLDSAGIGPWARGSPYVYPVANTLHLLGLVMLVGGIGVVDLRVAGLWRSIPVDALSKALTPVAIAGLLLMVPTGTLLFAADGSALARSDMLARKLVLIAIAITNAVVFRLIWGRRIAGWTGPIPTPARIMAAASILLWLTIAVHGRWIAYT
jgi:hypothetical protein